MTSSKRKGRGGYFEYKKGSILFEQAKMLDARRLMNRKESITKNKLSEIQQAFMGYLDNKIKKNQRLRERKR